MYLVPHHMLLIELPGLANKNAGCPVKSEFQINNEQFLSMPLILHGTYLY